MLYDQFSKMRLLKSKPFNKIIYHCSLFIKLTWKLFYNYIYIYNYFIFIEHVYFNSFKLNKHIILVKF